MNLHPLLPTLLLLLPTLAHAQTNPTPTLPSEALHALQHIPTALNPFTIETTSHYLTYPTIAERRSLQTFVNDSEKDGDRNPPVRTLLKYANGKFFNHYVYTNGKEFPSDRSFNGTQHFIGVPEFISDGLKSPLLTISSVKQLADQDDPTNLIFYDYLSDCGIHIPHTAKQLLTENQLASELLYQLSDGATLLDVTSTDFHGTPALRVKLSTEDPDRKAALDTDPKTLYNGEPGGPSPAVASMLRINKLERALPQQRHYTYYLDPAKGYALLCREEGYKDNKPLQQLLAADFQQVATTHVWLPKTITMTFHSWPSLPGQYFPKPIAVESFQLVTFNTTPIPEDTFTLTSRYTLPGTTITDFSTDPPKTTTVSGERIPAEEEPTTDTVPTTVPTIPPLAATPTPGTTTPLTTKLLAALAIALFLTLGLFLLKKSKSQ